MHKMDNSGEPIVYHRALCSAVLCMCAQSVELFGTPWTVARQAPLSIGSPRQEHWSKLPFPCLLRLLHWQVASFPLSHAVT